MKDFFKYAFLRKYCRLNRKFLKSRFTLSFILKRDFKKLHFSNFVVWLVLEILIEFDQIFFQLFNKHIAMFSQKWFSNFYFFEF